MMWDPKSVHMSHVNDSSHTVRGHFRLQMVWSSNFRESSLLLVKIIQPKEHDSTSASVETGATPPEEKIRNARERELVANQWLSFIRRVYGWVLPRGVLLSLTMSYPKDPHTLSRGTWALQAYKNSLQLTSEGMWIHRVTLYVDPHTFSEGDCTDSCVGNRGVQVVLRIWIP